MIRTDHNAHFLFQLTQGLAKKENKPHHFSPEYIFALQFTENYDEFTEYFPEFGRLRELGKMTILVRYLENIQENNNAKLARINAREELREEQDDHYQHEGWAELRRAILFSALVALTENIASKQVKELEQFRKKHCLDLDINSKAVKAVCRTFYEIKKAEYIRANGFFSRFDAACPSFEKVFEERAIEALEIARSDHREYLKKALIKSFKASLSLICVGEVLKERLFEALFDGNVFPLAFAFYFASLPERFSSLELLLTRKKDKLPTRVGILAGLTYFLEAEVTQGNVLGILLNDKETIQRFESRINAVEIPLSEDENKLRGVWIREINNQKARLKQERASAEALKKNLKALRFGKDTKDPDLSDTCTWVPAAMQQGLFGRANRQVYGGVSLTPSVHQSVGNNPTTAQMVKNLNRHRNLSRVRSNTLAEQRKQVNRTIPVSSGTFRGRRASVARKYRFFQAEQAKRASARQAAQSSRGQGQAVRSSSGAGAAAGGSGGNGGDGKPPGNFIYAKPFDLKPTEKISRNRKQFRKFIEKVKVNGITESIKFVEHEGQKYVVDGHHRLRAAKILGISSVPIEEVKLPYKSYRKVSDLLHYFGP